MRFSLTTRNLFIASPVAAAPSPLAMLAAPPARGGAMVSFTRSFAGMTRWGGAFAGVTVGA